jgi:3-dehydroquinate synthase
MTDSCIGKKTGINYENIKNQVALFAGPKKIFIYTPFLTTLTNAEIQSGIGEIIKLLLIGGYNLENIDYSSYDFIKKILLIKKSIIEFDEFERNIRKSLNYGHTFGHAIESATNNKIPHGIAVSIGMIMINDIFGFTKYNDEIKKYIDIKFLDMIKNIDLDIFNKAL